jgi:hypothetical protein
MESRQAIKAFLATVRRTLHRQIGLRTAWAAIAAALAIGLIAPLLALWAAPEAGRTIGLVTLLVGLAIVITGSYLGYLAPRRRWRGDREVARFVGTRDRRIASDLLSSVELADSAAADRHGGVSPDLIDALIDHTAERTRELEPRALVPVRRTRQARIAMLSAALLYAAIYLLAPAQLAAGWKRLVTAPIPGPFGGAELSETPLVGDISITLDHPSYTGRERTVLPSGSGDVRAMAGTLLEIETTALGPVDKAQIVFGEPDQPGELENVEMEVTGRTLKARFPVTGAVTYRFLLEAAGERRTERTGHQIEIEEDEAPAVELYAPAEELDVTALKRIELAYIAEDDYGIAKVELVMKGTREQRKALPLAEPGRRTAQAKYILDLAEIALEPGVRVAYHVEVTDNDDVLGPNVGRSKVYYLRVFSPRERHEALVDRQEELFEKLVRLLGGRLVVEPEDLAAHLPLQRGTAEAVIELGGLIAALEDDELASKELLSVLGAMRARLDKLSKAESKLLDRLAGVQAQGQSKQVAARLAASDRPQVAELESDVLLLADWIDRQRLEGILAITDEIKGHQDRLKALFKEYARTGSDEIKKEIDRELKALEQKLAELARKQGQLPSDVMDQFVNADARQTDQLKSCTDEVRDLLAAGDAEAAEKKMAECSQSLDDAARALEDSLSALRSDKFTEQEKKFGELMNDLADLTRDQNDIADAAADVWERYADRADEMMRDKAKETRKKLSKTIDKLKKRLDKIPEGGLTPFAKEELDIVDSRVQDLEEMLADGDIAEALAMAKQAAASLETMDAELESALEDEPRGPFARKTRESRKALGKAQPLADKLVDELEEATPSPEEIMSPGDRRALEKLRRRQKAVEGRARRLSKKVQKNADQLPGEVGEMVPKQLDEASEPMKRAGKRMRARDPSAARQASREAADKLEQIRKGAQGAARQQQSMGGRGLRDEPVRIPGADEYKAPEKFREEILDAMKKDGAPSGFDELVKRYYEELIR